MSRPAGPFDKRLGAAIAASRARSGLSQAQLGAAVGVSAQQIQKYQTGASRISAATLWGLAVALRVKAATLLAKGAGL